jgi:hypothetical protein
MLGRMPSRYVPMLASEIADFEERIRSVADGGGHLDPGRTHRGRRHDVRPRPGRRAGSRRGRIGCLWRPRPPRGRADALTLSVPSIASAKDASPSSYFDRIGKRLPLPLPQNRESFATYAFGILGEGDRKSVEPIAAKASGCDRYSRVHTRGGARKASGASDPLRMGPLRGACADSPGCRGPEPKVETHT